MFLVNIFGIYVLVCIDIEVCNFGINIILMLFFINEFEGVDSIFFNFVGDGGGGEELFQFENVFVNVGV